MLDAAQRALMRAIGVTRVARVTGLDRTGVEVACAVRPGGHVLQVCNGKGETFSQAAWSALAEAAELSCAERPRSPAASVEGTDLFSGERRAVAAGVVHCPPRGVPMGAPADRWTSNGFGAHPRREKALAHALLELIERDQLARAAPDGLTERVLRERLVDAKPPLADRVRKGGFDVHFLDLSGRGRGAIALPVAGALLVDRDHGPVPIAAGYACRLRRDGALRAALLEACQSRLTDVHGARDDVQPMHPDDVGGLRAALQRVRPRRDARAMADVRARDEVAAILAALRAAGHREAIAVDVAPEGLGLHVVKVVVPGLRLSELL